MKTSAYLLALVAGACCSSAASAALRVVDFDTTASGSPIAAGTVITNEYVDWGVTFTPNTMPAGQPSASGSSSPVWASNFQLKTAAVGGTDVGGGSAGAGNLVHSFNDWLGENGDPSFMVSFAEPMNSISVLFSGISAGGHTGFIAYSGATPVADLRVMSGALGGAAQTLSISEVGIITHIVVFPGTFDDWVGVDNIEFDYVVPAPASAIALLGLPLINRRRRR